jgi:hypothetical protein
MFKAVQGMVQRLTASLFKSQYGNRVLSGVISTHPSLHQGSSSMLNRIQLIKIRNKAMRAGVWFKALQRIDRILVDLTIKVAENIRSSSLAKNIFAVVSKLEGLLESSISQSIRTTGRLLAEKLSSIAQKWGNTSAKAWAVDVSFAYYLAIITQAQTSS